MDVCLPMAWSRARSEGESSFVGFCRAEVPHDGLLDEEKSDLAYDDGGSGVWRFFVRKDSRTASKMGVQQVAHRLALEQDSDTPFSVVHGRRKKLLLEEARRQVLGSTVPKVSVVPVVLVDDLLWVGSRSVALDLLGLLSSALGTLSSDSMVFREDVGWDSMCSACLISSAKSMHISRDVELLQVDLSGKSLTLKTSMQPLLELVSSGDFDSSVTRLHFQVVIGGQSIGVSMDVDGVFRVSPAPSRGGLPDQRLRRRFFDAEAGCHRLSEVLCELVTSLS